MGQFGGVLFARKVNVTILFGMGWWLRNKSFLHGATYSHVGLFKCRIVCLHIDQKIFESNFLGFNVGGV